MQTVYLTTADFKEKIFNYETSETWSYKGTTPAIIDFYADWCGPCKAIAPVLEELAMEYDGRLTIYKVNTDVEQELSAVFGIQSIPTFLFIPLTGTPMLQPGAFPKNVFREVIEDKLLSEPKEEEEASI
jgi:thioredoxin